MILGNTKAFKGTGYVCFLDVLGFSNDILKNWNSPTLKPLENILLIKEELPIIREVAEDDRETHRTYSCRVSTVSDSVTICFGFNSPIVVGDLALGLQAVLANVSYIWSKFIANGYTIRGAVDFGDIYWNENELIGPAFINAYRLESQVAKNSRIVVSSNLNGLFKNLMTGYSSTVTDHLIRNFRKDVDGYIIIDPKILYRSDSERDFLIKKLKEIRDAAPSGIVREKYNPLISMLADNQTIDLRGSDVGMY